MKIAQLICAIWMCSPLALQAGAAESSGYSSSSRAQTHEPTRVSSVKGAISKGGTTTAIVSPHGGPLAAQREAGQLARSNADRLHSLLRTQATPAAKPSSRPAAGSRRAEAAGAALTRTPGFQGAARVSLTQPLLSKITARGPRSANSPGEKAATRTSLIGGPHPAGPGRVGGPAVGQAATASRAALDGAQIRRRF